MIKPWKGFTFSSLLFRVYIKVKKERNYGTSLTQVYRNVCSYHTALYFIYKKRIIIHTIFWLMVIKCRYYNLVFFPFIFSSIDLCMSSFCLLLFSHRGTRMRLSLCVRSFAWAEIRCSRCRVPQSRTLCSPHWRSMCLCLSLSSFSLYVCVRLSLSEFSSVVL